MACGLLVLTQALGVSTSRPHAAPNTGTCVTRMSLLPHRALPCGRGSRPAAGRVLAKHQRCSLAWRGGQAKLTAWCEAELGAGRSCGRKTSARPQRAEHHVREGTVQVCRPGGWQLSVPCTSLVVCICMAWKAARAQLVHLLFLGRSPWLHHRAGLDLVPICGARSASHGAMVIPGRVCNSCLLRQDCLLSGQGSLG